MISRDPKCAFVAEHVAHATVVANWLESQGIPAKVMDVMTLGGLDGLTAWTGVSSRGIEVWVLQADDVDRARSLLEEHDELRRDQDRQESPSHPVLAYCDACGNAAEFPAEQRDTRQPCPQCGASVYVSEGEPGDEELVADGTRRVHKFELKSLQKPIIVLILVVSALYFCFMLLTAIVSMLSG